MASSLARFRQVLKPPFPKDTRCTYREPTPDPGECFPVFTKDLYLSVFKPPIRDRHIDDDREMDHQELLKTLQHIGSGRMGKTVSAMKKDMTKYPAGQHKKPDFSDQVAVTKMAASRVDYVEAVRLAELFSMKHHDMSPMLCQVLLKFRSKMPYHIEHFYLVSECWPKGSSLCRRLEMVGSFTEKDARYYMMQIAHALMCLHKYKKIVRRLCLCNVLLNEHGFVKLSPYSLCDQNLDCGQACNMLARQCGDQFYASPEVVFGVDVQPAADWWSFGVILYELLSGKLPFSGRTLGDLGKAITENDLEVPGNLSGEAVALLRQLLHKDPRRRLGWGPHGSADVKAHPWFSGHVWEDVSDTTFPAPYKPMDDDKAMFPAKRSDKIGEVSEFKLKTKVKDNMKLRSSQCQRSNRL